MRIKKGASVTGLQPEIIIALMIARRIYIRYGLEDRLVITSGTDWTEGRVRTSEHQHGFAVDLRHPGCTGARLDDFVKDLAEDLGPEYQLVVEHDHLHIEFDR